jgi:DNA-binding response OmpR family regulator
MKSSPSSEDGASPSKAMEVLIVDDNPSVVKALSKLAQNAGFVPIGCESGAAALSYAKESIPAAAVVDVHLPDLSGLILAQKLRDRFGPLTPIIVVSGDTSMETINSLPYIGATHFFSKPLSGTMLMGRLKELIGAADQGSPGAT